MPPEQNHDKKEAPAAPNEAPKPPRQADPASFLLPKKEAAPAQRVNAGALLAQEQSAELPKTPAPPLPPPKAPEGIAPLQTYKSDVEKVIESGASVISIAAAEADKPKSVSEMVEQVKSWTLSSAMVLGGLLLVVAAVGTVAYVALRPTTTPVAQSPQPPFIAVDDSVAVVAPANAEHTGFMQSLIAARSSTNIATGLLKWLYIERSAEGPELSAQEFMSLLSPLAPPALVRTLTGR